MPSGSAELRMEGSTWYGNIPIDWSVDRFKRIATIRNGQVDPEDDRYKDLPLYAPNHIESGTGRLLEVESADTQGAESGKFLVEPGEVVYSKIRPELRKVIVAPFKGLCSADMYPVRPLYRVEAHFLYYEMLSDGFSQYTLLESGRVAMPKINRKALGECIFVYPDRKQQARICEYLDLSCAAIDAAVAAKRRQLDTLDELRKSIISRAVTQGLNPQAKMKSFVLDWLSEGPAHWQVQQIKRVCSLVRGQFSHRPRNDPAFYDGPYPFVQTGDITAAGKYIRTYSQTLNELGLSVSKRFPRGTLVMSIAANIGDVAILDFEACFPDSMIGMIPGHKTNLDFLYYLMRAMRGIMLRSAVQSTQLNLNYVRIGTNFAPFPPLKEQSAIAEYLDAKERESHLISNTIETQIATLTAYRKSLIHECVTGQRRITEADLVWVGRGESISSRPSR